MSVSEIEFTDLSVEDAFKLARRANVEVYTRALPVAEQIARRYAKKYDWISVEDLTQNLMFDIPAIMYTYDENNKAKNSWGKYLYYKLYFKAKDYLRKEDPLGIKWPQKKAYPKWHRLGDESLDGFEVVDLRSTEEEDEFVSDLLADIASWREYFATLPPLPKRRKPLHWDSKRGRVKFRRSKLTLWDWYLAKKSPRQMALEF